MAKPPDIKHVKYVRSKGKLYAYFNTGKKVNGKAVYVPLPNPASPDFYVRYGVLRKARDQAPAAVYTIAKLAQDYEASREFGERAQSTQYVYRLTINKIVDALGKFPVEDLRREDLTTVLENEKGPGAYNLFIAVLGTLYRFGRRTGKTALKPTEDFVKLETGEHAAWPESLVEAGLEAEHDRTRLAIHLLYFTGQRIGDVVRMRWNDIKRGRIHVTQQKTGKDLKIPIAAELQAELDRTPKTGMTILTDNIGGPISDQRVRDEIKTFGRQHGHKIVPHGLRKNAVISLLEAGCTVAETAAITGQTFQLVEYYARQIDQDRLGSAAIVKLENKRRTGKPNGKPSSKSA